MSLSILFWGFKNTALLGDCLNKIKQNDQYQKFYIQISHSQQTSSLINFYPEELIRADTTHVDYLLTWIPSVIDPMVIVDVWSLLECQDTSWLDDFEEVLATKCYFIFLGPDLKSLSERKSPPSRKYIEKFFSLVRKIYESILNSKSDSIVITSPPPTYLLTDDDETKYFDPQKILQINFLPKIIHSSSFAFQTKEGMIEQILSAYKYFYNKKKGKLNENFIFPSEKKENSHELIINKKERYKRMFIFHISLELFYKSKKTKEEILFIQWVLHLGRSSFSLRESV